ncbi:hypothetical protein [Actinoplanes sp. G11-F43]|uniref:hypothetical protein n=1 Tax=Actinoplanes sp. G11-F43 TaxID=3424130 RepID=UPI003D339626
MADLRFLPVVDAFRHFAHDVSAGRLALKAVKPAIAAIAAIAAFAAFAQSEITTMRTVFPACRL